MEAVEGPKGVILVAGVFALLLALFIQGVLPAMLPETRRDTVTRVVRTDLGELKWIQAKATPYTPLELQGRRIYQREGCWYCHSQYVRPVNDETLRWGPVSEAGEYSFDAPHFWGTQRIGPDLTRVGLKYANGWHYAHHWDPRLVVPDSNMPAFPWLFRTPVTVELTTGEDGQPALPDTPALRALGLDPNGAQVLPLFPGPDGLTFVPIFDTLHGRLVDNRGKRPVLRFGQFRTFEGKTLTLLAPTEELPALVAYIQKLGTNRGKWRDLFVSQRAFADGNFTLEGGPDQVAFGKVVYEHRCIGCHGAKGDGWGAAATFFDVQPRDFQLGVFKFRTTPSGSLPTDGDLLRTLTNGVRGTAMPTWHELPFRERAAVIQYIKTFSERWQQEAPPPSIAIAAQPPAASAELLARGKEVWDEAQCAQCHGERGKGDGPSAPDLTDDFGFPILPADLTTGLFKSGAGVRDIFRTMSTGLDGTPMPSFADAFPDENDRWALAYHVLSLSAYHDPLYATPEPFPDSVKQALDDPEEAHRTPAAAYQWTGLTDRNLPVYRMPAR
ncbi:MAG TPA: cbb3-type cytochrome c oxidase subunit II [Thermodesulfobacteriota bacterium]